jgi:hypothetical protein
MLLVSEGGWFCVTLIPLYRLSVQSDIYVCCCIGSRLKCVTVAQELARGAVKDVMFEHGAPGEDVI